MPNDPQFNNQFDSSDQEAEPSGNRLSKNQKIAAASLAVFAFLIVVLWFIQLKNNIYGPLNSNLAEPNSQAPIDDQTANDLALKNKDTDSDGLSDYDELNIYKTSPYLEDSDSDGASDGEEINKGADPNCPQGRTCFAGASAGAAAATSTGIAAPSGPDALNDLLNKYNAVNPLLQPGAASPGAGLSGGQASGDQAALLENLDPASLRQMLLSAGMPKEALDKLSDAELMQSFKETLSEQKQ